MRVLIVLIVLVGCGADGDPFVPVMAGTEIATVTETVTETATETATEATL